ncbi:MAG: hypothetical protein M3Q27_00785 [Actinomycetota bacterium]|nr:hypothetical protein [Actinomycetota bacterium]
MLRSLRSPDGRPALRVRLVALLVVLGMVLLAAPVVLVPLVRWLFGVIV